MRLRDLTALYLAPLLLIAPGCAHTVRSLAGAAPDPLISESLETLDETENQRRVASILSSPEVRDATRGLVINLTDGTLDALDDDERQARIGALTDQFIAKVSEALGKSIRDDIGPALAATVARTMDQTLEHALSAENTERMQLLMAEAIRGAVAALADALQEELLPALGEAARDPRTQEALAATSRTIASSFVVGLDDGFRRVEGREPPETLLTRLQDGANEGVTLLQLGAIGLTLLAIALGVGLVHTRRKAREHEAAVGRREGALVAILEAMKASEDEPWGPSLKRNLRERFREDDRLEFLRDILRDRDPVERTDNGNGRDMHS